MISSFPARRIHILRQFCSFYRVCAVSRWTQKNNDEQQGISSDAYNEDLCRDLLVRFMCVLLSAKFTQKLCNFPRTLWIEHSTYNAVQSLTMLLFHTIQVWTKWKYKPLYAAFFQEKKLIWKFYEKPYELIVKTWAQTKIS